MNRIVCPKCRANNMPGQPRCFQCGSSLPPPEALQQVAAYPQQSYVAPQQPVYQQTAHQPQPPFHNQFSAQPFQNHSPKSSNMRVYIIIAIVAASCGLMTVFASRKVATHRQAESMGTEAQVAELDRLRKEHGINQPAAPPQDADADATRRELDRLRNKYGIGTSNPHNPSDGSVPNGGAVTFDQWRRQHNDSTNYQFK
jgi:hypothetical protein